MIIEPPDSARLLRLRRAAAAVVATAAAMLAVQDAAAQGTIGRDAQRIYQQEAAGCRGSARQDHATCMREAAAARDESRRGRLADQGTDYSKNALQRCDALPAADRQDCMARMEGQGKASGSVEAGGIYRESVTRRPARVLSPVVPPPPRATDTTPGAPRN